MAKTPITVAHGDGIGPEIMDATLRIIDAAGAELDIETIVIGEKVYLSGNNSGIAEGAFDSLRRTKVFLKAPITTPQGGGFKSVNVTTRKAFGLFANVRPCVSLHPFVKTKHPVMDVVIVRENEEDLYAGIEYRQSTDCVHAIKLMTYPGTKKIVQYAFEYARQHGRKRVTCFTKDNILKMTDGLFHKMYDEVGAEYPEIEKEHWIVDIGAAKLADTPEKFDVIVLPNLYGDILSDVAAQLTGSVGLAGSANIGEGCSMFEAIHGSAPRLAGQNKANPSGLLHGAILMLIHIGQAEAAERVHNAWLRTIEDGIHTYDIYDAASSKEQVSTSGFADAVIARIGQKPETLKTVSYAAAAQAKPFQFSYERPKVLKEFAGVDVFIEWFGNRPPEVGAKIQPIAEPEFELYLISNRGQKVWPGGMEETFCVDHWRLRFLVKGQGVRPNSDATPQVVTLLNRLAAAGIDVLKTENLYHYDGEKAYTAAQGS